MRKIKFRAWDKRDREMSKVFSLDDLYQAGLMGLRLEHKEVDYIIMQYTGLMDKNGKEIYMGDITQEKRRDALITFIVKPKDWLGFTFEDPKGIYGHNEDEGHNLKVIGNLYENPELLNEI